MSFVRIPNVQVIAESDKAILVTTDEGEVWVPKSVVGDDSEVYEEGHEGVLVVKEWWATKNETLRDYVE